MTTAELDALRVGDRFTVRGREYELYGWAGTTFGVRNGREYARIPVFAARGGKSFVTVYLED